MATLNSLSNPKIKQIRALQQRKQRSASGLFVVEGIHHVGEAFAAGADVKYVCYAPELLTSEFARGLVDEQERRGVPCYAAAANIFTTLAEKENPQGILAVVGKHSVALFASALASEALHRQYRGLLRSYKSIGFDVYEKEDA